MKVILQKNIPSLGKAGEIKQVADGFAVNYLLPKNLAVPATPEKIAQVEERLRRELERRALETDEAKKLASELEGKMFEIFSKAGPKGKLFGSIDEKLISKVISEKIGFVVKPEEIIIFSPIKQVGEYEIKIQFLPEVIANIKLIIGPETK